VGQLTVDDLEAQQSHEGEGGHVGKVVAPQLEVGAYAHDSRVLCPCELGRMLPTKQRQWPFEGGQTHVVDDLVEELHCVAEKHDGDDVPVDLVA
jgi:hypothetical protein